MLFDNEFYLNSPKFLHFFFSWFSEAALNPTLPTLAWFQLSSFSDFLLYGRPDLRFGAAGPWFGLSLVMSITALPRISLYAAGTIVGLFALYISLPGVGTMRYYPAIQIVPILALICLFGSRLFIPMALIIGFNVSIVAAGSIALQIKRQVDLQNTVQYFHTNSQQALVFQDGSYLMDNVLNGVLNKYGGGPVDCKPVHELIPYSPRPGKVCNVENQ